MSVPPDAPPQGGDAHSSSPEADQPGIESVIERICDVLRKEHREQQDRLHDVLRKQHQLLLRQGKALDLLLEHVDADGPNPRSLGSHVAARNSNPQLPPSEREAPTGTHTRTSSKVSTSVSPDAHLDWLSVTPQAPRPLPNAQVAEPTSECPTLHTPNCEASTPEAPDLSQHLRRAHSVAFTVASAASQEYIESDPSDKSDDDGQREEWMKHMRKQALRGLVRTRTSIVVGHDWRMQLLPKLQCIVESAAFQWGSAGAIVLNVLFIGFTTNTSMANVLAGHLSADPPSFEVANAAFTGLFGLELILRILAYGSDFILGPDARWNAFDTGMALSSIVDLAVQDLVVGVGALRMFRGLRMFRILRVIRVMRYCRDLRLMACSILQSLGSLSWALLLLMLIMYLFSIVFMQGAVLFFIDQLEQGEPLDTLVKDGVELWYDTVFQTMYTMLASVVNGVSWVEVVRPLEQISFVYRALFAFYIVFTVIGVLNVLTGIFVERACELSGMDKDLVIQSQMRRNENFSSEMKQIFNEADADGSGTIDWLEFKRYLENDRVKAYLSMQQLDAFDARTLFELISEGRNKEMTIETFIVGCQRLKGMARSVDLLAVLHETRAVNKRMKAMKRQLRSMTAASSTGVACRGNSVSTQSSLSPEVW